MSFGDALKQGSDVRHINFSSGFGGGYFLGLTYEYLRPYDDWGFQGQIKPFDRRTAQTETGKFVYSPANSREAYYTAKTVYDYLSISTLARYNISQKGVHLLGGFDFDFFN